MTKRSASAPADANAAYDQHITVADIARFFGITQAQVEAYRGALPWPSLSYRILTGRERDQVIRGIIERTDTADLRVVGGNDNTVWQRGWGEILEQIEQKGFDPALLHPQYLMHHNIMRYDGQYIEAANTDFICGLDHLLRQITLAHYLKGAKKVVELGCGTGTSQLMLCDLLPEAKLVASDWAPPSQGIVRAIGGHKKREIKPVCFNMLTLEGWDELGIDKDTTVLTVHALEQLGGNHARLLETLLAAGPRECMHLEPIAEFYDASNLFDYLALRYHKRRNYLDGFLTALRALAAQKKIEIIEERRLGFGDRYHEAFSVVKWKPL